MTRKPAPPPARFPVVLDRVAQAQPGTATLRPQRPLHEAARDARRQHQPSGVGLDSQAVRARLVERLRRELGAHDAVCRAMLAVPRHHFVDSALVTQAYEDTSLPIGLQQTISKPSVVARMLGLLIDGATARAAGRLGRVLEIGTGCGYQTALLAQLGTRVVSVERLQALHAKARAHLDALGCRDVRLVWGDGRLGHAPNSPYDSIVAAAGGDDVPAAWIDQLADGGRLVAPVQRPGGGQALLVVDRRGDDCRRTLHEAVHFVPLKSGLG
ncbi:MAG TPA: protein-L-isoaspartate(D-aspartate) O-methyltransferase [Rubrivivax sp.]|nr:protein-L-isoaspartate(D-aspartate) O-methyltransferase [Pseudomonadota bacterium]HOW48923.1 protein-L-isoaspartate(D-aspartate) O-methyltransferase [Rubrivivax sp.]HRY87765.1 protein-L-isoaspartate(D-aspartate) O-methyltransferase [Rubrivivax sp.]HRZ60052.1 protein-L-isoaspartate(D-aspartate) O-methyltransferase [Rubrivivax sp.]